MSIRVSDILAGAKKMHFGKYLGHGLTDLMFT
jgi:hypothetical protein